MNQHFSGGGAKVTQKFKPIDGEIVDEVNGFFSDKVEQKHTDKNIKKYGYDNVRGGKYVNSKTLHKSDKKKSVTCFKCGQIGHYADKCYSQKTQNKNEFDMNDMNDYLIDSDDSDMNYSD